MQDAVSGGEFYSAAADCFGETRHVLHMYPAHHELGNIITKTTFVIIIAADVRIPAVALLPLTLLELRLEDWLLLVLAWA